MFQLKNYQQNTLQTLEKYLSDVKFIGAKEAFHNMLPSKSYNSIDSLEEVPYVCLRLPTGGGKTFLAAHSISVASKAYLEKEYPAVIWFVPSTTIKQQTLETLKNINHSNRKILEESFGGNISIFDIDDYVNVRPQDLENKVCVFISTIQTFRITDKSQRLIYAHNENLEAHFKKIDINKFTDLARIEKGIADEGKIKFSFANLLHIHRPLVIADEAHNNTTDLGYEVLKYINPSCIIEYTATPSDKSNILCNVSAMELKTEEMIKLPIILTEHQSWEESLSASVLMQKNLFKIAQKDNDYIRPIVLIQAESNDRDTTVDIVKRYLIENENIEVSKIAIATGDQKELDGINILNEACPIEYVITKEALKEGWDCSFAYIFCSVANINSPRAVEQFLGRVLRMPYAKARTQQELNKAYAFVSTSGWANSVALLHDSLVCMGFEEEEASNFIEQSEFEISEQAVTRQVSIICQDKINKNKLEGIDKNDIKIEETQLGQKITILNYNEEIRNKVLEAVSKKDRTTAETVMKIFEIEQRKKQSQISIKEIEIPQLLLFVNDTWEVADKEYFFDDHSWKLLDYPSVLTEADFNIIENGKSYEIDLQGKKIKERFIQQSFFLNFYDTNSSDWTVSDISVWLTKKIRQDDIKHEVLLAFIRQIIENLMVKRQILLGTLIRLKFILAQSIETKISEYRKDALKKGFQQTLFSNVAKVKTDFDYKIQFSKNTQYLPNHIYNGSKLFNKHFFGMIDNMNSEEEKCALVIDALDNVEVWIRNIEKHPSSFYLPTSTDNFYPDFIIKLKDGRVGAIEYKGEHLISSDDTKEKDAVGKLWEQSSNGRCLYITVGKENMEQIIKSKFSKK